MRSITDHEYWPEYATLVLRDAAGEPISGLVAPQGYDPTHEAPVGTVAIGGFGWLHLRVSGEMQQVRIEVHDSAPAAPDENWDDIQEIPYLSAHGTISIETLLGRPEAPSVALATPGLQRARVCRRSGTHWAVQLWPVAEPAEPPLWLRRGSPLTESVSRGWSYILDYDSDDLRSIVASAAGRVGATAEQLDDWCAAHRRPGWLDEPLEPDLPVPPGRLLRAEFAAQLGLGAPATRRELLIVLATAGVLSFDDSSGRYAPVSTLPAVRDVLDLTAAQLTQVQFQDRSERLDLLLADLICLAAWSVPRLNTPLNRLSEILLAPPAVVHETIRFGQQRSLLAVEALPNPDRSAETVTLTHRVPPVG
jgi:hypothetical protein